MPDTRDPYTGEPVDTQPPNTIAAGVPPDHGYDATKPSQLGETGYSWATYLVVDEHGVALVSRRKTGREGDDLRRADMKRLARHPHPPEPDPAP